MGSRNSFPRSAWERTARPLRGVRRSRSAGQSEATTRSAGEAGSHAERGNQEKVCEPPGLSRREAESGGDKPRRSLTEPSLRGARQ